MARGPDSLWLLGIMLLYLEMKSFKYSLESRRRLSNHHFLPIISHWQCYILRRAKQAMVEVTHDKPCIVAIPQNKSSSSIELYNNLFHMYQNGLAFTIKNYN